MVDPYLPSRGDIIWLDFSLTLGREQAGHRPALVLSNLRFNRVTGLALTCPITSRARGFPFEVPLPADLPVTGIVLGQQLKSVDWRARGSEFAARAPDVVVQAVLARVRPLLA